MDCLVSALVACYNSELTVGPCLRSLAKLDFADEIIVVDNGSQDRSPLIAEQVAREYDRVRFFHRPELETLVENRRYALKLARGCWVCRFDADYIFYSHTQCPAMAELREFLAESGLDGPTQIRFQQHSLRGDFRHYVPSYSYDFVPRIYRNVNLVAETRGRYEGFFYISRSPAKRFVRRIDRLLGLRCEPSIPEVYVFDRPWVHANVKSPCALVERKYRNEYRQLPRSEKDKWSGVYDYVRKAVLPHSRWCSLEDMLNDVEFMYAGDYGNSNAVKISFELPDELESFLANSPVVQLRQRDGVLVPVYDDDWFAKVYSQISEFNDFSLGRT